MIISAITRKNGKLKLIAKGALRRRSGISGSIRAGSIGEIIYYYRAARGLQTLKEASFSEGFHTDSLEKICIFQAILELANMVIVEGGGDKETFDIAKAAIEALRTAKDPWYVFFAFEIGVLRINGTYPESSRCSRCSANLTGEVYINPKGAEILCERCYYRGSIRISRESFGIMREMEDIQLFEIKEGELGALSRKEIGKALHYIMMYHIDGYRLPASLKMLQEVN